MIPKQRNHPNIVNKLIGKSSLKSKNRLMKISPNLHTNLAVLLQQKKLQLLIFCSKKNAQHALFSAPENSPFTPPFQPPQFSALSKKTLPGSTSFNLKELHAVALMGLRGKKWAAKKHWAGPTLHLSPKFSNMSSQNLG